MTTVTQCDSVRGLSVIAGLNIATTITNLFNIVFIQLGACISIVAVSYTHLSGWQDADKWSVKQKGFEGMGRKQTEWKAWMEREKEDLTETGQTFVPMVASFAAVGSNAVLDFLLIFGIGPIRCV